MIPAAGSRVLPLVRKPRASGDDPYEHLMDGYYWG